MRTLTAGILLLAASTSSFADDVTDEEEPARNLELENYLIPAAEILTFNVLLNLFDRTFLESDDFDSDWETIKRNATHSWVFDTDPFLMNQLAHPYHGALDHGFARSAGLNYWEALAYDFVSSVIWEVAGEATDPSINDQMTTAIGGSFLGEALFRMASLLLENGGKHPGGWRELGAAALSPGTGFNRAVFGNRFDEVFASRDPAHFGRLRIGGTWNTRESDIAGVDKLRRAAANVDVVFDYGLPGKPGYQYDRPFDYFHFEASASSRPDAYIESLVARGLLWGAEYEHDRSVRGIWGLYGSYDFFQPEIFRVSSTALSVGTTGQAWLSEKVALQGSVLLGVGFGAGGSIRPRGMRDYHFGVVPQALVNLRFIFGDTATLDLTGREFFVSGEGSDDEYGEENIARGDVALTVRLYEDHALCVQYSAAWRDAYYVNQPELHQSIGTVGLYYTLLCDRKLGAQDWREKK